MESNNNDYVLILEDRTEVKNEAEVGKLSVVSNIDEKGKLKPAPLPLFCYKKESAYSDLWTHKKNVIMEQQKVNITSSMNSKGYSSSSHYRINPTAEKSELVLAIKFVQWNVPLFGEPL